MAELRHITSAKDFGFLDFLEIFRTAEELRAIYNDPVKRLSLMYLLKKANGEAFRFRILYSGASTRTIGSFEDAIETMGGEVKTNPLEFSSAAKGETHRSTLRIHGPRCDCIIIRDDKDDYAAKKMAEAAEEYGLATVVIDGGSGSRQHSTQALVDPYTIWRRDKLRFMNGELTLALVGDLSHSRTIHSNLIGLSQFGGKVFLVGPEEENVPDWVFSEIDTNKISVEKIINPRDIAALVDYWYITRIQDNLRKGKRLSKKQIEHYIRVYGASIRKYARTDSWFLHPLPANQEYPEKIDLMDSRFIHYEQADNGFFVRMALLKLIFVPTLDIRTILAEQQSVWVSGYFSRPIELPAQLINAVCPEPSCPRVRVHTNWVDMDPEVKKHLIKAKTVCDRCHPQFYIAK
ncbi:MAG: hypothetical protein HYT37_03150 [Candidatus Sungbacteria bacterium]|nr:hypothetical protein [Candidatus Sungbacteria bacterium]